MTQNTVNTGTVANDGTGDTLRSAFIKINEDIQNFLVVLPIMKQI